MEDRLDFAIESLVIKIYTNIASKTQIVDFKRSMLVPDDSPDEETEKIALDDYPKFTVDIEYPLDILRDLTYNERINFFFNSSKFVEILKPYFNTEYVNDDDDDSDTYHKILEKRTRRNIMTMMEVLFPTKFPVINDIQTSHDYLKDTQSTRPFWFNPFQKHYFSYLNINSNKYTIKKTVWLNDILNHPYYRKIITEYIKFKKWADEQMYSTNKYKNPDDQQKEYEKKIKTEFDKLKLEVNKLHDEAKLSNLNKELTIEFQNLKNLVNKEYNQNELKTYIGNDNWITKANPNIFGSQLGKKPNRTELQKIHDNIKEIFEDLKKLDGKIEKATKYFKQTITESEKKDRAIVIRKFATLMSGYKSPLRETSNIELQNLINGLSGTDEVATKFYEFMDALYMKYIKNENVTYNNLLELSNVGISYINIGETNKPTREVYFMFDLIDGEITDDNVNSIYCPFMGEYLGNQLEYLIQESKHKGNKWAVDKNRKMFSLKDVESSIENNFANQELRETNTKISNELLNTAKTTEKYKNSEALSSNFSSYILKNATEIQEKIDSLQKKYIDNQISDMNINKLLDFINQNTDNKFSSELYRVINLWNQDMIYKNNKVLSSIITLDGHLTTRNSILEESKTMNEVKNDASNKSLALINREMEINKLYSLLVTNLINHEKSKKEKITGGTKKAKRIRNKYTKKKYKR
jgi:succinate dehydrogenase flavin-adding protein (antitoxin of CptAB toxin-antitoxin module)